MAAKSLAEICVPVCVAASAALDSALAQACHTADVVEIRLDCLRQSELPSVVSQLSDRLKLLKKRTILTLRPVEEGGMVPYSKPFRRQFWLNEAPRVASFFDIELDLVEELSSAALRMIDWERVICSYHDFEGSLRELKQVYDRMSLTPARVLKIAVRVNEVTDCILLFQLLAGAKASGREMIAIGMGQAGIVTRVLGPARGSFLTYGAMNTGTATAPGQPTARELLEVFRVRGISDATQVMGLVGSATAHSISHHLHNAAFAALSLDAVYLPLEVQDLAAFVTRMVRTGTRELDWNLRGLSITAPHKSDVIKYLDHIEPAAKEIGAVNTIVLNDGELHGYNTDAAGFIQPLIEKLGAVSGLRCAVIGSGGVARTACWALMNRGALVTVFARSVESGRALADDFALEFELLNHKSMAGFDVVVNSTSVGTKGVSEAETVFTADQLRGVGLAYDLVYNPRETRFLREARRAGCDTLGGLSMLLTQAKLQFRLWTNRECPEGVMEAAGEESLA